MMSLEAFLPEIILATFVAVVGFSAWLYFTREHAKLERRDRERAARR